MMRPVLPPDLITPDRRRVLALVDQVDACGVNAERSVKGGDDGGSQFANFVERRRNGRPERCRPRALRSLATELEFEVDAAAYDVLL